MESMWECFVLACVARSALTEFSLQKNASVSIEGTQNGTYTKSILVPTTYLLFPIDQYSYVFETCSSSFVMFLRWQCQLDTECLYTDTVYGIHMHDARIYYSSLGKENNDIVCQYIIQYIVCQLIVFLSLYGTERNKGDTYCIQPRCNRFCVSKFTVWGSNCCKNGRAKIIIKSWMSNDDLMITIRSTFVSRTNGRHGAWTVHSFWND